MSNQPREQSERTEPDYLSKYATYSTALPGSSRQHPQEKDDFRTEFERDYTRILHSRAFRRLRHKTQVFIDPKNDHICSRLEHSLHVASVARTISKALRLNNDLVAAIAIGHDLGHAPFGHMGERTLNEIAQEHGASFYHELHSLRIVDRLESPYASFDYAGLNLTFAVRDGIACHYGEGFEPRLTPNRQKEPASLESMKRGASMPATLEGCVVRWADKVAYIGRDLEDALTLGLVKEADIPANVRNVLKIADIRTCNGSVISALIHEVYANSVEQDAIQIGEEVHAALNDLYAFNMDRIYRSEIATKGASEIKVAMRAMFEYVLCMLIDAENNPRRIGTNSNKYHQVLSEFLANDVVYWQKASSAKLTTDFIAGMTDSFFVDFYNELIAYPKNLAPLEAATPLTRPLWEPTV